MTIRLACLTALGALAASPALAYSLEPVQAPRFSAHFTNTAPLARMMSEDVSAPPIRDAPPETKAKKDLIKLSKKGQPADHINISDPNDNPFMAAFIKDDPKDTPKDQAKTAPAPAH